MIAATTGRPETPERVIRMKPSAECRTVVVHNRLTLRETRLAAARERRRGLQIMAFEQPAARPAGGLVRPVDDDALRDAIGFRAVGCGSAGPRLRRTDKKMPLAPRREFDGAGAVRIGQ